MARSWPWENYCLFLYAIYQCELVLCKLGGEHFCTLYLIVGAGSDEITWGADVFPQFFKIGAMGEGSQNKMS